MQLDDTDELVLARAQHYGAPEVNFERLSGCADSDLLDSVAPQ